MADDRPIRLLFDAIEAGRAALRERDERDVPAKLRTVAASSSRVLPPPLSRRLLAELEGDPALRSEACDALSDTAGRASFLFLTRPDGWDSEYHQLVAEHRSHVEKRVATRDDRRLADLEREVKAARAKARDATKRAAAVEAEAEERVAAARRDIKTAGKSAARRASQLEARLEQIDAERRDLISELERVKGDLAALRAQRRKKEHTAGSPSDRIGLGSEPDTLARALDDIMVRAQQPHDPSADEGTVDEILALPAGIAHDRADAVEWLLQSGLPQVWIVDGHNFAHRFDPNRFTDPQLRVEIAEALTRMRRRSLGPLRATIVFDTGAPVGDHLQAAAGIDVTFVGDADAEVVHLARTHGTRAVVVSSDGEVRGGAERAGAVVIWSEALVEFLRG